MPLNDFFMPNRERIDDFKDGSITDRAGNELAIKYHLMERSEISRISLIQNVIMGQNEVMILTTSDVDMNPSTKIVLDDGFQYSFVSQYDAKSKNENNPLHLKGSPARKYITLRRIAS
jgi:hypothetical protein